MLELNNAQIRKLKALAQRLEPMLKVGRNGLSEGFVASVEEALVTHELVKIRFDEFKERKKELSDQLAASTGSVAVMRVGHVVVLFRQNPEPEKRRIQV